MTGAALACPRRSAARRGQKGPTILVVGRRALYVGMSYLLNTRAQPYRPARDQLLATTSRPTPRWPARPPSRRGRPAPLDDAAGTAPVIHLLGDVLELVVLLASRIKLAGLALAVLVVLAVALAIRRSRRNRRDR